MTDYVRVCPRCGHVSPEYDNVCAVCQQFIGMEETVPASAQPAVTQPPPSPLALPVSPAAGPLTQRFVAAEPALFLEAKGGTLLPVRPGWTLGQAHPSSDAEVQLPTRLAGVEFVHRHHCRFDHEESRWYVTALDQWSLGRDFTNPTLVNSRPVPSGKRVSLADGDELRLSGVVLRVRVS
jgi:hypothetical protein